MTMGYLLLIGYWLKRILFKEQKVNIASEVSGFVKSGYVTHTFYTMTVL